MLRTTDLGIKLIKSFEGLKLKAYKCPAGIWTVGYGHTTAAGGLAVTAHTRITERQAEELLADDIDHFEDYVERMVKGVDLQPHQFDALVSFAFNAGLDSLKSSTLLKRVLAGRFDEVPGQFMRWTKARVDGNLTEVSGLVRRRRAEAALWRGDLEEVSRYAGVDFGPMPQSVEPPVPSKTMAHSTIGNTTIVGTAVGAIAAGKAALDQITPVVQGVNALATQTQAVAAQAQATAEAAKATATTAQATVSAAQAAAVNTASLLPALPWIVMLIVVVGCGLYVWRERQRKLREEGI
jgi:lysozyme